MLQKLLIYNTDGILLYVKDWKKEMEKEDPTFITGFLSALNSFAVQIGMANVQQIQTEKYILFGTNLKENDLSLILITDKDDDPTSCTRILNEISEKFIDKFCMFLKVEKVPDRRIFTIFDEILNDIEKDFNTDSLRETMRKQIKILSGIGKKKKDEV